jgi:hypothetical protein
LWRDVNFRGFVIVNRLLVAAIAALLPLYAQTSSLQGTVTDAQNAAIADAIVSLINTDTTAQRKSLASSVGAYSFVQVPPGNYRVEVQHPGFRKFSSQIRLQINTPATLNVALELGQVTETVNVSEEAVSINTQNATIGSPFTEVQVRQLPLQTRNVVELLALQPGVTSTGQVIAFWRCCRFRSTRCRSSAPRSPGRAPIRAGPQAGRFPLSPSPGPTTSTARCMSFTAT